jgi:hypothetical protein
MTDTATTQPSYPLQRPADTDTQFTYGLLHEVADVLQRNGFPARTAPTGRT